MVTGGWGYLGDLIDRGSLILNDGSANGHLMTSHEGVSRAPAQSTTAQAAAAATATAEAAAGWW